LYSEKSSNTFPSPNLEISLGRISRLDTRMKSYKN
jgi:hypothetical protein